MRRLELVWYREGELLHTGAKHLLKGACDRIRSASLLQRAQAEVDGVGNARRLGISVVVVDEGLTDVNHAENLERRQEILRIH